MASRWVFAEGQFCEQTQLLSGPAGDTSLEPRVAALLAEFLRHPGDVLSHDHLLETVWDGRVVSDEAVRRAASSLRHALAQVGLGRPLRTVHKKGYICDLVAEQVERGWGKAGPQPGAAISSGMPPGESSASRASRRKLGPAPVLVLSILLLSVAAALIWRSLTPAAPELQAEAVATAGALPTTLAVLPFSSYMPGEENSLFADGMAEELINLLGRFQSFRVTSRTSAFQFREQSMDVREFGRELGVNYVVEGSVRREGEQLRISAALISTRSGFQQWSGSYEREGLAGLLNAQAEIAREIARALQVVLVEERYGTAAVAPERAEARREYWRALALARSWQSDDLNRAVEHLQRAISLDPGFARAYVELAKVLLQRAANDEARSPQTRSSVMTLTDRALELDPNLGEAYVTRASIHEVGDLDVTEADLREGIRLSPSSSYGYEQLAQLLSERGDLRGSRAMIDRAIALDPLRPRTYHIKSYLEHTECNFAAAEALEREALRLDPRFRAALANLAYGSAWRGELVQAADYLEQARAQDPSSEWIWDRLLMVYLTLGDVAAAEQLNDPPSLFRTLMLHVFRNEEQALARELFAADPAQLRTLRNYARPLLLRAALATAEFDRALTLAETVGDTWEQIVGQESRLDEVPLLTDHVYLLVLRQHVEGAAAVDRQLAALRGMLRDQADAGWRCGTDRQPQATALAELASGDRRAAVAALARAARERTLLPSSWWELRHNPVFAPLEDFPDYRALIADGEALAARQRALRAGAAGTGADAPAPAMLPES